LKADRIKDAIDRAVDEINDQLPKGRKLEKAQDAVVFGNNGQLDSLGLVSFIIEVEQKLDEEFGVSITLADERALSQQNSPFMTLGKLADYISLLIEDHGTRNNS
jgi:acyl carrier protein